MSEVSEEGQDFALRLGRVDMLGDSSLLSISGRLDRQNYVLLESRE